MASEECRARLLAANEGKENSSQSRGASEICPAVDTGQGYATEIRLEVEVMQLKSGRNLFAEGKSFFFLFLFLLSPLNDSARAGCILLTRPKGMF